ncbi:hypothetical protein LSH36_757g00001 [Paralvinella palmiformis]|uniref:Uncharacterized protein n=1 Tax=Paralvinella palmiformis TaxID=53620 RepID=A0AAD9J0I5_9ANNE|nr:hypothetical protein LSH36_757g00001 [Paralvinella palmiformis]
MGLTTVIRDYGTEILNAIRENDIQKLKLILEKTLRSDAKIAKLCVTDIKHKPTKKFACPLILAARQEDPRIMKYMMDKGTDPNFVHHTIFSSKRREIVTALHLAVDLGHYDTVEVLLNANGDANIYDHNKETPLHIAVKKADHMMVKLLLSKGADPLIPDNKNNAALHIATLYGHLQMVRTLLKYDADIYQKGQWETVPPLIAAKEGHTHLVQLFSANDLSIINVKIPCYLDRREKAQIHLAAENGHAECLSVLLEEFDADVNLKDSDGNTALHSVVLHPYDVHRMRDKEYFTQSARLLLKFRVSINEKNIFGDTALHFAAMNHYHRIVELLLDNGANPFLENEDGMKPIDTVPDSDPVTKQILKMAMKKGRPPLSIGSTAHRRVADGSMNNTTLQDSILLDQSRSNISYRSASSSSSVFIDETRQHRSHRSRDADGRHSHSRSKSKLPEVMETPSTENEPSQEQGIYQRTENEIAVYSKVNKKKPKQRPTEGKQTDLGYDQQEWEIISTATMNEESVQGSVISLHDKDKSSTERRANSQRSNHQQQSYLAELANDDKQQDYIDKKNRINKHQKPSSVPGDLSLDTAIPQPGDEAQPQRMGQPGEIIYENIPPLVTEEAPPLPPRKNRPTSNLDEQVGDEQEAMESSEKGGVKVHTVPGRPSAIEVQYEGGPITISVETPQVPTDNTKSEENISSRSSKHKRYSASSPQQHRKQSASPKIKRKHDIDPPAGQLYNEGVNQQMVEEISTRKKHSPQRHKSGSENYTSGSVQEYSADYYQKKALKKKKKSKQKAEEVSDPTAHREQSVDDYLIGSYDISELESLQQSMISESSQPELIRRIIQQKIADLLEQKARETEKHEKSKDKMKQWLIETDEQDEETEEDEDDKEHILDSDVWSDDEEFQTPGEWLGTKDEDDSDDHYDDHESGNDIERQLRKVETKSTSVKQQCVSRQQVSEQTQKEMHRPKEVTVNREEISSNATRKSLAKSLQKIKIDKESTQEFIPSEQTEYDKDGNATSVKSPGSMTFQEKLAWAKAKEKRQAKLETPTKHQVANTQNISTQEANVALVVDEKQKQQKSKGTDGLASGIRDQMKLTDHHGEYYSLTHGIDSSSTSTSTDISTAVSKQSERGFQNVKEAQIHLEEDVTMEVEEYEGSPFSRRKAKDIRSTVDMKAESTRQRSKSQNDIIDVHQDERSVSPVTLKDIPKHGLRTASVLSEGTGLGLKVSGQVPKAYTHSERGAARRAFMLANPVKIESSSECSDSELHGSRGSVSEVSGRKDRGKLWEEPMLKPVYPKHSSGLTSSTPTSDAEISPRSNSENT